MSASVVHTGFNNQASYDVSADYFFEGYRDRRVTLSSLKTTNILCDAGVRRAEAADG